MINVLDFFKFIIKPDHKRWDLQGYQSLVVTLVFFIMLLPLTYVISLPANFWPHPEKDLVDMLGESLSNPSLLALFFVVFLGPVWEEIIFRYALKASPRRILVSGLFLLSYLTLELWSFFPGLPGGLDVWLPVILIFQMGFAYFLGWIIPRLFPLVEWDKEMALEKPGVWGAYLHFLAFAFAQMHLLNYHILTPQGWGLAFFLNLPRWFLGLGLSYVRIRLGLLWAMVLHITNNAFFVLIYRLSGAV